MAPTAEQLARAMETTFDRYRKGCMSRVTMKAHLMALAGRAVDGGIYQIVKAQVSEDVRRYIYREDR